MTVQLFLVAVHDWLVDFFIYCFIWLSY